MAGSPSGVARVGGGVGFLVSPLVVTAAISAADAYAKDFNVSPPAYRSPAEPAGTLLSAGSEYLRADISGYQARSCRKLDGERPKRPPVSARRRGFLSPRRDLSLRGSRSRHHPRSQPSFAPMPPSRTASIASGMDGPSTSKLQSKVNVRLNIRQPLSRRSKRSM